MRFWRSMWFYVGLILAVAFGWKIFLITADLIPFNGDEAVVGLMARHILQGERPIFFYGQAYMGSLDAYLVAGAFLIFGEQVWAIRLVQALLYMGTLATTVWLGIEAFGSRRVGLLAAMLLAVPSVNATLYTTASLGGYGEALLIGNLVVIYAIRLARNFGLREMAIWAFLVGFGLWVNALTLTYSLPAFLYLALHWRKKTLRVLLQAGFTAALFFLAGSAPWWIFAVQNGFQQLLVELLGSAVSVEQGGFLTKIGLHLINLLLLGLPAAWGLRPPWSVEWLVLPILPFILIFWMAVSVFIVRKMARQGPQHAIYMLLGGIPAVVFAGFIFTNFGADPSGRYFLPLAVPLALAGVQMILGLERLRGWRMYLVGLILAYQLLGNAQIAQKTPPGFTTQFDQQTIVDHRYDADLIAFLQQKGETRGYSNYWVAYPLAFESAEQLIFTPRLPYHSDLRYTERDSRYRRYDDMVAESAKTAYISTLNTPALDEALRSGFRTLNVTWQEELIGDYRVFFALSQPVRPYELGLGVTRK